ncbi:Small GTPase superfamily, ARF/SAR type [Penicillium italicum]|uniref:Small GTPase superfamily, ARF/SAR type n=1 Tax=Penicillium italicum TaxID=40296 RepID=A0A0A2KYT9_PENIT|nr:Small GTPase superfamily, ARF/SAR type [Penicillium italicum]
MAPKALQGVIKWLYGQSEPRVLLVGEAASGKTTFISQLTLGQVVYTFPTMGYYPTPFKYKRRTYMLWDTGMGCFRYPIWITYFYTADTSVLFFHDCSLDEEYTQQSLDLLSAIGKEMLHVGYRSLWVILNKQDCMSAQGVDHLRRVYDEKLKELFDDPVNCRVIDYFVSGKTGEGVKQVMDELHVFTTGIEKGHHQQRIPEDIAQKQFQKEQVSEDHDLKVRIEEDGSRDHVDFQQFWHSFMSASLTEWDHRSHLKSGFIVTLESIKGGKNVFEMAETFLGHLKRLRTMKPDLFRNTEHRTMTIFWLAQLQNAILKYKLHTKKEEFPYWNDFQQVLLYTPSLMNTGLWRLYYTKEHMFSEVARESWSLPDLQPLPGLSNRNQDSPSGQVSNPDRLLQYAFAVIQHTLTSGSRRGQVVKEALDSLKMITIRLRTTNSSVPPYSETQAYFWIQVVHAAIQSLEATPGSSTSEMSIVDVPASRISSATLNALFGLSSSTWRQYYSEKVWNSISARMEFVQPDLKPIPNVIIPSQSQEQAALFKQMEVSLLRRSPELPTPECLSFQAIWVIRDVQALAESSMVDPPSISSHSHLLLYLYRKLIVGLENGRPGKAALEQAEKMSGPRVDSVTHKMFWIQVFLIAMARAEASRKMANEQTSTEKVTFETFIRGNLHLVYEDLPSLYYTPEIWESKEASEVIIAPDRRRMDGFEESRNKDKPEEFVFI